MSAPVAPGDILAQKYEVEEVLGEGGMGVVVSARHVQLGQKVALKFMLPAALGQPGAADRFLREARAAARLRSEHVARVIDVGTLETGAPYMVMEFLKGNDLGQLLRQRGPLPVELAVSYLLQACMGMAEAHQQGIVHRDIKPENLFLTTRPDGSPLVKVLDFGVSKILDGTSDLSATRTGIAMGSPAYMSPEQMRSAKDADARADIWSLGAVLFQLLSSELPFNAETFTEMMARVLTESPRPLEQICPHVPPGVVAVVRGCMERDVTRRIQTVEELMSALAPYAGTGEFTGSIRLATPPPVGFPTPIPGAQATPIPGAGAPVPAQPTTTAAGEISATSPAKSRTGLVAGGLVALAVVVGAVVIATQGADSPAVEEPAVPTAAATPPTTTVPAANLTPADAAPAAAAPMDAAPPPPDAAPPDAAAKPSSKPERTPRKPQRPPRGPRNPDSDVFGTMQ